LQRGRADRSSLPRGPAFLLLVLLATACVSLAQTQALQPDDQPGTIRGTVVNSVTGAPISRALVFTPGNHIAMLTDGEGHFEFALPKTPNENLSGANGGQRYIAGPTVLMARKPGFLDNPNRQPPIEANPGAEIVLPLLPEALVKGRIISSETDPAAGIHVQLFSRQVQDGMPKWLPAGSTGANSNGEFRFAELQPGTYKLMTDELLDNDPVIAAPGGQQYGFPPIYFPGVSDDSAAGTLQLTAGQTVQADIPITHQPYFKVEIPVANPDPDTNLNVTVSVQGHSGNSYALGYNREKHTIEGLLPNGKYFVEATAGPNIATGQVNLSVAGAAAQGPMLTLIPNSSIPVHVTEQFTATDSNASGTTGFFGNRGHTFPLHGPRLYLQLSAQSADDFGGRGAGLRPPTSQNDDALVLESLPPGRYWLRAYSSRGYVASATLGGVDLLREPMVVGSGSSVPIEITMRDDTAELDGTVAGITAPAITESSSSTFTHQPPQAWVYCVPAPDSPGQFQQIWASPDGKLNSPAMPPGVYRVLAFANQQPNLPYRDAEAMRAYESKGQVVHLSAGQKASVQLQLIPSIE
jgi:hypothetical protein